MRFNAVINDFPIMNELIVDWLNPIELLPKNVYDHFTIEYITNDIARRPK